jgi:hypothetical protein
MFDVNVDRDDPLPLHEQVAADIRPCGPYDCSAMRAYWTSGEAAE